MRADKFLFKCLRVGRNQARQLIAQGVVYCDGIQLRYSSEDIPNFSEVVVNGEVVYSSKPVYILLHKPRGVVSATVDDEDQTVIDLVDHPDVKSLHIAGRLDKNTTGLVVLTNDGKWSRDLTNPDSLKPKVYLVKSQYSISEKMISAFREGIYFEKEQVMTHPAIVELIGEYEMRLTIFEGMHHQIKRMFLKFENKVLQLHREQVADLVLDFPEGEWREIKKPPC